MPASRHYQNIALTPELAAFLDERLASGDYADASEVLRTALKLLRDKEGPLTAIDPVSIPDQWPAAGGECGALIRAKDWSLTPLGPRHTWPAPLRVTLDNILNSPVAKVLMWGPDHIMLYNDSYRAIAGDRHPLALGSPVASAFPEVWDWNRPILEAGRRGEIQSHRDQPILFKRGESTETLILDLFYTPVYADGGTVGGVMCTIVDNSRRVDVEQQLAAREAELRRIADALPMLVCYVDREHVYRFANECYNDWLGISPTDMVGRAVQQVVGDAFYQDRLPSIRRGLSGETFSCEAMMPHKDGRTRRCEFRYLPHIEADGSVPGVHILAIDIEERANRVAALSVSNGRFQTAMQAVHGVLWTNSADGRMVGEQPGWAALTGQTFEAYQNFGWSEVVHPDDIGPTIEAWAAAVKAQSMFLCEHRIRSLSGDWRTFVVRALPILDEEARVLEWVGVHTDITHQRAAEAALREQAETLAREAHHRKRAEEQLRQLNENLEARVITEIGERRQAESKLAQAQKMETIGKLTGGVAHDFNNLLQVVSGNLQLLAKDVAGMAPAERRIANAMAGVSRGTKLASQLLAFGRRQALEPKVINVSRVIRGMDEMLRRAIGEGIEVETVVGGGLWNTFIDPAQVENALLNLAINARDAMAGHGKLTIELGNAFLDDAYAEGHDEVVPGQYVLLAVSDTGSGMSPDIITKVFEPFFSTKEEGKGSGLGLSMVYGFVKQSGGHVKIYSEPGEGTTIKLYLPRAMQTEDIEVVGETGPIAGGTETVLVVEDDDEVRAIVVEMLADLGYRVLKAVDAASALTVVESGVAIDLIFTDVVMPGRLKSPEMARQARLRIPGVAVLFTSGYTENSIVHGGKLDAGVDLLSKPYSREALARKLRHVLANQKQRNLTGGAAAAAAPPPTDLEPAAKASVVTLRVLLVEDDGLIRMNTADMLLDGGFEVIDVGSAEEAIELLETSAIDILMTDVTLPGMSGVELATLVREKDAELGIIFATGDPSIDVGQLAAVMLTKPYRLDDLMEAIHKTL